MNDQRIIYRLEAIQAGREDARLLIANICDPKAEQVPANFVVESLSEIIGLAVELRTHESHHRLEGFASIIGPALAEHFNRAAERAEASKKWQTRGSSTGEAATAKETT